MGISDAASIESSTIEVKRKDFEKQKPKKKAGTTSISSRNPGFFFSDVDVLH